MLSEISKGPYPVLCVQLAFFSPPRTWCSPPAVPLLPLALSSALFLTLLSSLTHSNPGATRLPPDLCPVALMRFLMKSMSGSLLTGSMTGASFGAQLGLHSARTTLYPFSLCFSHFCSVLASHPLYPTGGHQLGIPWASCFFLSPIFILGKRRVASLSQRVSQKLSHLGYYTCKVLSKDPLISQILVSFSLTCKILRVGPHICSPFSHTALFYISCSQKFTCSS